MRREPRSIDRRTAHAFRHPLVARVCSQEHLFAKGHDVANNAYRPREWNMAMTMYERSTNLASSTGRLRGELGRVIVGQQDVIERLAICLFARGHALLMGVPGLAKTLLVSKLAETMSLKFSRIQFTPDLMPMDITGTDILQDGVNGRREFQFVHGPVFANIILADEINRAPPKTQAAMLEAMQERRVTAIGKPYVLEPPFLVLATQNPVEQEGTYPLPRGAARSLHVPDRARLPVGR